jgi:ferredoxin
MRITVDDGRCEGFGMCEQAAPDVLRSDSGLAEVLADPIPPGWAAAETAVRACPRGALRVLS